MKRTQEKKSKINLREMLEKYIEGAENLLTRKWHILDKAFLNIDWTQEED